MMYFRAIGARRSIPLRNIALKASLRTNVTSTSRVKIFENYDFMSQESLKPTDSPLPFDRIRHSETFGQLVITDDLKKTNQLDNEDYLDPVTTVEEEMSDSPFRDENGELLQGRNAEEARLHPLTLQGRVDRSVTKLPQEIAKAIRNNILSTTVPDKLRERCATIFQSVSKEQIQQAPETSLDCDAYIASLFLQNYSHSEQVLLELQSRVGKDNFKPMSVLDVGYGPGTGMLALNEIMGNDWIPDEKDVYVVGRRNNEMKKRAKILLSRQANENIVKAEEGVEEKEQESSEDYVGPVNAAKIKIKSKLRDSLPVTKQYDLIMVNQSLLTREYNFPRDIDINIHMVLKLLKPNGHIVLIERGNALGFETIARARQVMIRPESYTNESGKIPRPYTRGSSIKPQRLRKEDQLISEDDIKYEEQLLSEINEELGELAEELGEFNEDLEEQINAQYGEPTEDDMKFEFEDSEDFEVVNVSETEKLGSESVDYHISIIAPCSHHRKCPLQLGDPKYYKIPSHSHRLSICSFNKTVERPRFTMELKKGKRLATKWDKSAEDGFGIDKLQKNTLKKLSGSGRPGSNNTETGSFTYLIAQRAANNVESIKQIEYEREHFSSITIDEKDPNHWPRVILNPTKVKKNVKLTVSAPSGNIEVWQIPKSLGKQVYHDARKVNRGDLWPLSKKNATVRKQVSDKTIEKLEVLAKTQKKTFLKEQSRKKWKKIYSRNEEDFENDIVTMADSLATTMEQSKHYKQKGKKAKFDVNPFDYDGQ